MGLHINDNDLQGKGHASLSLDAVTPHHFDLRGMFKLLITLPRFLLR